MLVISGRFQFDSAMLCLRSFVGMALLLMAGAIIAAEPRVATPGEELMFEKEIRPLLAKHCFECHGEKKQEYGLRLDRRDHFLKGSDEGPVFNIGKPAESKLLKSIRREGDFAMPPDSKEKLSPEEVSKLSDWIKNGAPWPKQEHAGEDPAKAVANHWAFQPVKESPVPANPAGNAWVRTPVDAFIWEKLAAKNLQPSPAADPRTLLRRATYDVTGLPPSQAELDEFLKDPSPAAYERAVDRLLASPRYGERWGRYWLDLARYADTKGYVFQEDRAYHYAYVYRDWVINALNRDLPYDQFLLKQLAADLVSTDPNQPDPDRAAQGFLTLGRRFLNNKHDIIDDRIDVVMRTTQALTVACARCHDHKFDPIPTADYYSLYGVFDASKEQQVPLAPPSAEYTNGLQEREAKVNDYKNTELKKLREHIRQNVGDYLLLAQYKANDEARPELSKHLGKLNASKFLVERWKKELDRLEKEHSPVFAPFLALSKLPEKDFAAQAAPLCRDIAAKTLQSKPINDRVANIFMGEVPDSIHAVAQRYTSLFADVDQQWQAALKKAADEKQPTPQSLGDQPSEELRRVLYGDKAVAHIPDDQAENAFLKPAKDKLKKLREEVNDWRASDKAPLQALAMYDDEKPAKDHPILLRGNPGRHGARVPRQYLKVVAGEKRQPFSNGSGRLELARAIASPENPLTARVMVNRVWMHYFGSGLVGTGSDFGIRTAPPTHPELLDYLAARFVAEGWSLKKLHRQILLSAVYQQSSADRPEARAIDPENSLLWRANRRRLDLEALRDSLLVVSGTLDETMGGPSVEMVNPPKSRRRSVYGYIERQNLPGFFRTFDFASPDNHTSQRFMTTVPQQALFLLNSPFMVEMAAALSRREDVKDIDQVPAKVTAIFRATLGREPNADEMTAAQEFLGDTPAKPENKDQHQRWLRFAQALMLTNEFAFVD
jgi:cytochrome c553